MNRTAVVYALISAALFGVSTPAAKILVGTVLGQTCRFRQVGGLSDYPIIATE